MVDFVRIKLEDTKSTDLETLTKRDHFVRRLRNLMERIKDSNILSKLKRLERMERRDLEKAKVTINPSTFHQEQNAVAVWFDSAEAALEESFFQNAWRNCMSGNPMSGRDFTRASCYVRFTTCLESQNRAAAFDFTNRDFRERKEKWFPKGSEESMVAPEGWNANVPPVPGAKPTCYVIELSGAEKGMKMGEGTDIVLTERSHDLCLKFSEMKEQVLDSCEDSENFFVNARGVQLAPMVRKRGSLLMKFANVTGVSKFTTNSLRRAVDTKIQRDPNLIPHVKKIQSHSNKVSVEYYDKSGSDVRASVMSRMSEKISPYKGDSDVTEAVAERRSIKRRLELQKNLNEAKKMLSKKKLDRNMRLGKRCRVLPKDRHFMQVLFSKPEVGEIYAATRDGFPGGK